MKYAKKWVTTCFIGILSLGMATTAWAKPDKAEDKHQQVQQKKVIKNIEQLKEPVLQKQEILPLILDPTKQRPPGWDKGQKVGWQGKGEPPGQAKKDDPIKLSVHQILNLFDEPKSDKKAKN